MYVSSRPPLARLVTPLPQTPYIASLRSARGRSFGQTVETNESSVSPFPRNLTGSHASFPPDSVKSPKIPMLTGMLYKPSWPASHVWHFPLPPCRLSRLLLPQSPMAPVYCCRSATPPSSEDSSSWEATPRRRRSPRRSVARVVSLLGVRGTPTTRSAAAARRQLLPAAVAAEGVLD